jgi:hypothetical protein
LQNKAEKKKNVMKTKKDSVTPPEMAIGAAATERRNNFSKTMIDVAVSAVNGH